MSIYLVQWENTHWDKFEWGIANQIDCRGVCVKNYSGLYSTEKYCANANNNLFYHASRHIVCMYYTSTLNSGNMMHQMQRMLEIKLKLIKNLCLSL